ncbi:xanthine dehydrogenase 1 isoform X2 [Jatropha curcas]|uniref:xanthine dehydrogenase 1 isoform X2 n=1 Tax=Jatropha curcas TaxID=180498 RepID=UPI0009D6D49F|nr:xanthine dehydrogenase 1 isoform X2 [Jatropha curcas]
MLCLYYFIQIECLNNDIGLSGTKLGCGEGGCGACTVMVSHYNKRLKKCVHYALNACLAPLYSVEGMHVITVEGVGNCRSGLHPIQESLACSHGSQCGFCTPGFIMSMYALLRSSQKPPTEEEIEECLAGNLCRCTGYRPILDAFRVFAKSDDALYVDNSTVNLQGGEFVCPSTGKPCSCTSQAVTHPGNCIQNTACGERYGPVSYSEVNGSTYTDKEFIFPPELLLRKLTPLNLSGFGGLKWYRPLQLQQLLELKSKYPDAKLLIGNTEVGIEMRLKRIQYKVLISVAHVPELNVLNVKDDGLEIGAAVRLTEIMQMLRKVVNERVAQETSSCKALIEQLKWFAGTQIKNVASIGGNICTASPISDLNPLWMAARAKFRIVNCKGHIRTVLAENFFLDYRKVDLASDEVLLSVFLPWTRPFEYVKEFKQAHRRDDDIAIVNAGMRVFLEEKGKELVVSDASIVYGGVAPLSLSAIKAKEFLIGKNWNQELLQGCLKVLETDILLKDDAPGGMVEFRKSLTLSFFFKFFLWVSHQMDSKKSIGNIIPLSHLSAVQPFCRPSVVGSQDYEIRKHGTAVGSPEVHLSSKLQVTGEAEYADDTPMPSNGLYAALILSKKPHARIVSIDDSEAKSSPGFAGIFLAKDVPGDNHIGAVIDDEELFASEFVTCVGQVIGVVVADTHENAKLAARKVSVEYEELPAILSIQEAINAESFHPNSEKCLKKGDVELCFQSGKCDKILEGEVQVGGQEHFYLEPQSSLVWTMDGGNEVHMISSTQAPQKHQKHVAHVLGLSMSKVVCKTKRIGGGFGGKETRSAFIAAAASVPSYLLNRPVKITLDRDVDMMITGQRHSFLGKYKVGFTNDGKVLALDLKIYNGAGNSLDLSLAILERAMFHSENVYEIPNIRILGRVCFTNFPSHTAFRGFGGPQGMLIAENWIQRVAVELNKSPEEIRETNFQGDGSITHYGQQLQYCTLTQLWNELKLSCNLMKAREDTKQYNLHNRWKKRGVALVPTKFGISFTTKFMNQAGALVHVYTDGTVLVTHGGVEMGQGLHTKVAQIAASVFNIPLSSVFISETSTDKVPNASPTAASASSDMYGAAVLDACEQIKARMEPVASKHNFSSFAELASACYIQRIDLSAHGFYITPEIGFDWSTGKGNPFRYYTYGAAFAEVEIDTLTGDFHTRAADVILDLGYSLNPAIDVGQIEGAFIQGLGWVALEELKWGDSAHKWIRPGWLYTSGPGAYKIPSINDVPFKFKVSLLKGHPNVKAIHSSKAVGEPPFFLASAVFFAIKDAIKAARAEVGHHEWFPLDNPATPERIRMACLDEFTAPFINSDYRPKLSV